MQTFDTGQGTCRVPAEYLQTSDTDQDMEEEQEKAVDQ